MRVLFVMDPLQKLNLKWDTSLCLARELDRRGNTLWIADTGDIWFERNQLFVNAKKIHPSLRNAFQISKSQRFPLPQFDLIMLRKEPPFDESYLYLTYLLEQVAGKIPVVNHPRGIRNANEKLSILNFPKWIPETIVSNSPDKILEFWRRLRKDIVLKPLDQKGGKGVLLLKWGQRRAETILKRFTASGTKFVLAQQFLKGHGIRGEKRIVLLNGQLLAAYEKRPRHGDFRANLSLGAKAYPVKISAKEKQLIREMKPYLLKEGLLFVGIDVLAEQLIEVNVTCPAGITDAKALYPRLELVEAWADSLEALVSSYS